MKVIHFTSSRRFVRNLIEVDKDKVNSLIEDAFYRQHDRELAHATLEFLEKELYPRKEKVEFLKNWSEEMKNFEYDKPIIIYTEPYFPYSFYFKKEGDRIVQKENMIGIPFRNVEVIPKTSRDLCSSINPMLDVVSKIINSYKLKEKALNLSTIITLVTPVGFIPYNPRTLEPLISIANFSIPDITDYAIVERLTRVLRLRAELMGKKPPKDSNLNDVAFKFKYKEREKDVTWGKVEKICSKLLNQYFINEAKDFVRKNLKQKPILFLTGKIFSNSFRRVLNYYNIYDPELDVVREFLNSNLGDKEYMSWGLGTSKLIGKYITDSRGVKKFIPGKLERIIKELGCEKIDVVYCSSLLEEPLRERKLQGFFEIWFEDIGEKIYSKPIECRSGSIFFDFNEESLCTRERYDEWKKEVCEEKVKKLEGFIRSTNKIQQWTGIIQAIQMRVEKELYPFEVIGENSLEKCDYHFSDFLRTPVENVLKDFGLTAEIEAQEIKTAQGITSTLKELGEIGELIHDARRFCSLSKYDFSKFTELPLSFELGSQEYGDFIVGGKCDIALITEDGKVHVCDTKLGAPFSPPLGHVYQVLAACLAIAQKYGTEIDSGSNYYHTNLFKEGMVFIYHFTPDKINAISKDMIKQINDYLEMKDNPKNIAKYFKFYKDRMKDPEKIKKIVEEKLNVKIY